MRACWGEADRTGEQSEGGMEKGEATCVGCVFALCVCVCVMPERGECV